ncbi:tumor necrosis factor receptor superfamily member 14-like [Onychostoma macrolepis]|uniref:tumor necrosis factor receptor superfamily member 14-like n=1 Tax=Onychostoma macrolepis TaxID=369639 RepID=UPI002729FB50|nr:tumor necrosis factor receptor superfamily member 14-like [Onychostoma macrolepis]
MSSMKQKAQKSHHRTRDDLFSSQMCIFYNLPKLLPLFYVNIVLCVAACTNGEYEVNGECCPMCDPGKRVYRHCDEYTSTTCDSCPVMTFTDAPNGFTECLHCSVCDPSNGLRVKQVCTLISDTVCEPLPGYYCVDLLSNCKKAMKHSSCSPGQYINQNGTEFRDTVCDVCPGGSYSDGTFCKLHTNCESLDKLTIKEGTDTTDAECSKHLKAWDWIERIAVGTYFVWGALRAGAGLEVGDFQTKS